MSTHQAILKGIKSLPADRLVELLELIQSWTQSTPRSKKVPMDFAGAFKGMSKKDQAAFSARLREARNALFDRQA